LSKVSSGPDRARSSSERGTRPTNFTRRPLPAWDTDAERRRRELAEIMREERTPGSKRIHFGDA
jgi:hypothetical protein